VGEGRKQDKFLYPGISQQKYSTVKLWIKFCCFENVPEALIEISYLVTKDAIVSLEQVIWWSYAVLLLPFPQGRSEKTLFI